MKKADRMLARHLVGMYLEDRPENAAGAKEILVTSLFFVIWMCPPQTILIPTVTTSLLNF